MNKYKIIFENEEQDEIFDSEEEAEDYALYLISCTKQGAKIMNMSNPGDYEFDEENWEDPTNEIFEFED